MFRSYRLARTYAPTLDFEYRIARVCPDTELFFRKAGVAPSTYTRMLRVGTVSRRTAERLVCAYALADGRIDRSTAFAHLFVANPHRVVETRTGYHRDR